MQVYKRVRRKRTFMKVYMQSSRHFQLYCRDEEMGNESRCSCDSHYSVGQPCPACACCFRTRGRRQSCAALSPRQKKLGTNAMEWRLPLLCGTTLPRLWNISRSEQTSARIAVHRGWSIAISSNRAGEMPIAVHDKKKLQTSSSPDDYHSDLLAENN